MGLAVLAAEDLVGVEVDVVCEPHPGRLGAAEWDNENEEELAACELCPEILAAFKYGCVCTRCYFLLCEEKDDDEQGLSLSLG
jgi:hypothetical protein